METTIFYQVQPGPYWDWRIGLDLFLGGAGVGAFLVAVGLSAVYRGKYPRICQTAAWLCPILVLGGLVSLLFEMGQPLRLLLVFTRFAPTSPLWWGGFIQALFVVGGVVYAARWRGARPEEDAVRDRIGWVLTPVALMVGAYHGLLLAVMTSKPLWNTGPTVVAALLGFGTTGIAAVMFVHLLRMAWAGRTRDLEWLSHFLDDMRPTLQNALVVMLVAQVGTLILWWMSLQFGSLQDRESLAAANLAHGPMFWVLGVGLGLALPLALWAYATWNRKANDAALEVRMILVTSVLILLGGFFFRLAVVLAGQASVPPSTLS